MNSLYTHKFKGTLANVISEACGDLINLRDELEEWRDSLEEKFSNTPKYEAVSEAADSLSNIEEPEFDSVIPDREMEYIQRSTTKKRFDPGSKARRRDNAVLMLSEAQAALEKISADYSSAVESETEEAAESREAVRDAAEELKDELTSFIDEAESAEFEW